jgi:hypothetical protein
VKVLVCGGRKFSDWGSVKSTLNDIHFSTPITLVIEGGARGADRLGAAWAAGYGVRRQTFLANWTRDGKAAGPIRNQAMLDLGKPDLVVAFPGGRGTADMVKRARAAGVEVKVVE